METRKKRVGFITSSPLVKTGFSNHAKTLLPYLYKTDKYEIYLLNQGINFGHPELKRFPWNNEGIIRPGVVDQQKYNTDEGYKRLVHYGNLDVQDFILKNKLDVVIGIEDVWAFNKSYYYESEWYKYLKNNVLIWTTADSLPILPAFKEWAQNCPNIWFWSSFAEKSLKEENQELYKHCRTVPGTLNVDAFKVFNPIKKQELRQRFNIQPDETIIMYLGRNQLRKLFWSHMEALAKFKAQNPTQKVRLLFHCSWNEVAGWPLDRIREELGLTKEDVLTTHFCQACRYWDIRPFEGEPKECPNCKHPQGLITAGITSTITESELCEIYNVADAACSVFTSGGLEYFNVESLLCGLPLACVPYSCGEDFTDKNFVYPIDGHFTREQGTAFKKFVPNINSIVKFYKKIAEMDKRKRFDLGQLGREWALQTFSVKNIGKQVEDFIDSCSLIEWDYKIEYKPKDVMASVPPLDDNKTWIKELYKRILHLDQSDDDTGVLYWLDQLSKGMSRAQIENTFRQIAAQENQKHQTVDFKRFFKDNGKKRLMFCLPQSLGDIIMSVGLLENARKHYPKDQWDIYYMCLPQYFEVLQPYIGKYLDSLIPYQPQLDNQLLMEGQWDREGYVDVFLPLHYPTQRMLAYLNNGHGTNFLELKN